MWRPVTISGYENVPCQAAVQQQGEHMHAWAQFHPPGGRPMMVHASTDLAAIERELMRRNGLDKPGAESSGLFSRIKRKIKKAVKKVGRIKVVRAVVKTARRALNNPLVKAALAATPYGAAFLAARAAARVAAKALRGSGKARNFIRGAVRLARTGNPKGINAMRWLTRAMKSHFPQRAMMLAQAQGDELREWSMISGMCEAAPDTAIGCDGWHAQGEDAELGQELDALDEFSSSSGAWDGARWVAQRLSLRSMDKHPDELTARGALIDGRAALAARFA